MEILTINNLCKSYPKFDLENISFSMQQGSIMGFIGRNGAGKTTTMKSLLNIVHPQSGSVKFFGQEFLEHEQEIKQKIAFALGGVNYYQRKKIRTITNAYKPFYKDWDQTLYESYLERFSLDEEKTVISLSEGMKVKYALALALSHQAKLLILDEPTSGLDPVSRDDLLELFMDLVENGETSILFSTHVTSDLEKCADTITYIKNGRILSSMPKNDMIDKYKIIEGNADLLTEQIKDKLIGCKQRSGEFNALILTKDAENIKDAELSPATLESIMVYIEREQ